MSLAGLLVRDVTRLRAQLVTDSHGSEIKDWTNPDTITGKGWLAQRFHTEEGALREAEISTWHLTVYPNFDVQAHDRIVIDGQTFEVDGPPRPAWTPRGHHHTEVTLRIVEG